MKKLILTLVAVLALVGFACTSDEPTGIGTLPPTSEEPPASLSQADDFRLYLDSVDRSYLHSGESDATIDEYGAAVCAFWSDGVTPSDATTIVQVGAENGYSEDESIAMSAAATLAYCPEYEDDINSAAS